MKQVTGSNPSLPAYKVSIQLALDGHSFSAEGLGDNFEAEGPVTVGILTPRTLLVPEELFDAAGAAQLLAAAGMPVPVGDSIVWSPAQEGVVAVMAAGAEAIAAVREKLGDRAQFGTPLLHVPAMTGPTVWICRMPGLLYIKVYDNGLRFAEVVPAPGEADILYAVERVAACFPAAKHTLQLAGRDVKALRKLIGKRFKEILCVS